MGQAWKQKMETIGKNTGLQARNLLNCLARPEGFEPPTPRSVELLGARSQGSAKRTYPALPCFRNFSFVLVPPLLARSGHKLVTRYLQQGLFTSRLVIL